MDALMFESRWEQLKPEVFTPAHFTDVAIMTICYNFYVLLVQMVGVKMQVTVMTMQKCNLEPALFIYLQYNSPKATYLYCLQNCFIRISEI